MAEDRKNAEIDKQRRKYIERQILASDLYDDDGNLVYDFENNQIDTGVYDSGSDLADDSAITLGDDDDYSIVYDSGQDRLEIRREDGTAVATIDDGGNITVTGTVDGVDLDAHVNDADAHHSKYTDSEAQSAVNNDADHGSTAPHNYFSGSHNDLTNVGASDHHSRFTDAEAVTAVEGTDPLNLGGDLNVGGNIDASFFSSDGDILFTIDDDGNDGARVFSIDHDAATEVLFTVNESGTVEIPNGELQVGGNVVSKGVVVTGNVTLSSGAATVDTGVSSGTTATFQIAMGPTTDDSEVAASIEAQSGGNYVVHLDEINTSVGNPTVELDVIRVR